MTETLDRQQTEAGGRVDAWLAEFSAALTAGDVDRAAALFGEQSWWRDLVAFSWNICTVEGPAGVADLLRATLAGTEPSGWRTAEEPAEADGVTEAWLEFETAVGRGRGHLRLRDGPAATPSRAGAGL